MNEQSVLITSNSNTIGLEKELATKIENINKRMGLKIKIVSSTTLHSVQQEHHIGYEPQVYDNVTMYTNTTIIEIP